MELVAGLFIALFVLAAVVLPARAVIARKRLGQQLASGRDRDEALFRAMFPELQPHLHPERVVEFVTARLARGPSPAAYRWPGPAGFAEAAIAVGAVADKGRESVRVAGAAGNSLAEFQFERHPEGGVIRIGKGKLTADLRKPADPRVRYWHPDREFKWSRSGWIFRTPVADAPFESSTGSSGTSASGTDGADSPPAFAGRGGSFDGGGASGGWGDAPARASSASAAAAAAGIATAAVAASAWAEPAGAPAGGHEAPTSSDAAVDSPGHDSGDSSSDASGDSSSDSSGDSSSDSSGDSGSVSY
ncbi:MAG TPA: hypothetical protein PLK52_03655 [Usitatibacteraceae bacterium]|jgi:uncharacterized membrane protein YgcG|nr:hypothetical protein [Burkholderiales bacterium]HQY46235.1 hypothetical protein [Usitatibacteraceae bacterium]HRA22627.1 hypothetical protein [Usitatibacteraceae bacterium]